MFVPADFGSGASAPPPFYRNRWIGAVVLVVCLVLLLMFAMGMDAAVFNPYNATHQLTLTAGAASETRAPGRFQTPVPRDNQSNDQIVKLKREGF
jgi:hypothetical protein